MFTIEEIQVAVEKINTGADFPQFARDLKEIGVTRSDVFVMNGMAIYYGKDDFVVEGPPVYENLIVEQESSVPDLKDALSIHQNGETDFQTFCRQMAAAGVEKWIIDLSTMKVSYLDMAGKELIVEHIPN
ncbi:DUF1398 domain-containing protein [Pedobacter polaris]|uniref:DUF1398 domain-containing protein n=1 Tax=Pedobacter polaris TaxID=2571273 RepID=A0A4U1CR75_9SPHI|nr:DUF1398 family protein [Pedobacter polaris]TKC10184.1 DUF1398 domain-containing protein [Pedobacter polaris]